MDKGDDDEAKNKEDGFHDHREKDEEGWTEQELPYSISYADKGQKTTLKRKSNATSKGLRKHSNILVRIGILLLVSPK